MKTVSAVTQNAAVDRAVNVGGYNCYIECVDVYVFIMFCVPFQCRMTFYDNDSLMKHI